MGVHILKVKRPKTPQIFPWRQETESTKTGSNRHRNLPSQVGDKVCKRLLPSIHFYYSYASYNLIHGPDPDVCEGCGLTPKGTDKRDEPQPHFPYQQRPQPENQGSNDALQRLCSDNSGSSYSKHRWRKTSMRKSTKSIPIQEVTWRICSRG